MHIPECRHKATEIKHSHWRVQAHVIKQILSNGHICMTDSLTIGNGQWYGIHQDLCHERGYGLHICHFGTLWPCGNSCTLKHSELGCHPLKDVHAT